MQEELETKIQELEAQIAKLTQDNSELENNWKRALADYRNLQKRTEEEKESLVSFISGMLIKRFLGVLDNLELLEKHLDDEGLKMITKDFNQALIEEGVTPIETLGKDFDSETMEAIETIPGEQNKVMEVLNKGYMLKKSLHEKLLRPARVKVGSGEKDAN